MKVFTLKCSSVWPIIMPVVSPPLIQLAAGSNHKQFRSDRGKYSQIRNLCPYTHTPHAYRHTYTSREL